MGFNSGKDNLTDLEVDDGTLSVDASGNKVGVGTTSPSNVLQCNHTGADGDDGLLIVRSDSSTADTNLLGGVGFDSTDGNVPSSITEASAFIAAYAAEDHAATDKGADLVFGTSVINDNDDTASSEHVRILDSGKVGIGVVDPDAHLEVFDTGTQLKLSYDASNSTTLGVSSAGILTVTPSGGVVGISGMLANKQYIISTKANGATITAAESGGLIIQSTSDATTSNVVITLPATVTGLIYTFVYYGAAGQGFQISPNANDKIAGSTINHSGNAVTAAGSGGDAGRGVDDKDLILTASGSKVGDRVTLLGDGSGGWAILDGFGNWAFEA